MRYLFSLILYLTFFGYSYSQATVSGYYITKTNDSITTQIKIPKSIFGTVDFSKFLFKVEVNDGPDETKKLKPEDIKSFGFMYEEKAYQFFSKPTITENNLRFLEPLILGKKTSLYQFQTVNQNGALLGTFFTFEKSDGTYLFLNTGIGNLEKYRSALKDFYKDNQKLQELIDTKFQLKKNAKIDITEIIQAANKS